MTALDEGRPQVYVEDVNHVRARLVYLHVNSQRAARLLPAPRYVVVTAVRDGQAREYHVPVSAALVLAVLAEVELTAEFFGDEARLVRLARGVGVEAHDLLQRDHARVHLPQHGRDARRPLPPVEPHAL